MNGARLFFYILQIVKYLNLIIISETLTHFTQIGAIITI